MKRGARDFNDWKGTRAVREEYARLADDYDRRWSSYVTATLRETLYRLELGSSDRLLDVGCGTGALLSTVRRVNPTVTIIGVDLVPEMLSIARGKLGADVPLAAANAEYLPFHPSTFDVVVSTSSFHYWLQPTAGLSEIARVLRPGGRLVITDWCDDYLACRLCDLVLRLVDPAHHRSYGLKECEQWLEACGYKVSAIERYKINWLWGMMTATAFKPVVS
ncbi:MAG: class I SAM-dependent methyltransferase [Candidatus Tectomicrobia bacterium]|nr:class I SAM-dependent methyltransferase [Candidatus Tectomicrobia bacterium]